jgi:hypothetical protein
MEKDVNACVIAILIVVALQFGPLQTNKNALAHGISCGRLASFNAPLM